MIASDSRYASAPQLAYTTADGAQVTYVTPRVLPSPESYSPVALHRVTDSDRLDLIAWKSLGNPTLSWRIADANRFMHPGALPGEPGDTLVVPVAGGVAG